MIKRFRKNVKFAETEVAVLTPLGNEVTKVMKFYIIHLYSQYYLLAHKKHKINTKLVTFVTSLPFESAA